MVFLTEAYKAANCGPGPVVIYLNIPGHIWEDIDGMKIFDVQPSYIGGCEGRLENTKTSLSVCFKMFAQTFGLFPENIANLNSSYAVSHNYMGDST